MEITAGEAFAVLNDGQMFGSITAQERSITADGTVFSVNVQTGSMGVNVFEGNVDAQRDKEVQAEDGQTISVVGEEMTVMELQASSLNQFNIEKALLAGEKHELCFSQEERTEYWRTGSLKERRREKKPSLRKALREPAMLPARTRLRADLLSPMAAVQAAAAAREDRDLLPVTIIPAP